MLIAMATIMFMILVAMWLLAPNPSGTEVAEVELLKTPLEPIPVPISA